MEQRVYGGRGCHEQRLKGVGRARCNQGAVQPNPVPGALSRGGTCLQDRAAGGEAPHNAGRDANQPTRFPEDPESFGILLATPHTAGKLDIFGASGSFRHFFRWGLASARAESRRSRECEQFRPRVLESFVPSGWVAGTSLLISAPVCRSGISIANQLRSGLPVSHRDES